MTHSAAPVSAAGGAGDARGRHGRHRHVHAAHHQPVHRPPERRGLRRAAQDPRRPHAPRNLYLCGTDQGLLGIVGRDAQRHHHGQPARAPAGDAGLNPAAARPLQDGVAVARPGSCATAARPASHRGRRHRPARHCRGDGGRCRPTAALRRARVVGRGRPPSPHSTGSGLRSAGRTPPGSCERGAAIPGCMILQTGSLRSAPNSALPRRGRTSLLERFMAYDWLKGVADRLRCRRHRQRPGRPDRRQLPRQVRAQGAAARTPLPVRRPGHVVHAQGRAHLRHLAARLPRRHDQVGAQILDPGDRRLDRPAQGHPVRQSAVGPHHDLRPDGFHPPADRAVPGDRRRRWSGSSPTCGR